MKSRTIVVLAAVALLVLLWAMGNAVAGPPRQGPEGEGDVTIAGTVAERISYQGRLTDAAGNPLDGTYSMVLTFFDAERDGTALWWSGYPAVEVENGLFNIDPSVRQSYFDGRELWIEVQVGNETLTPRQEILPVPYALSLRPGARIKGDIDGDSVLYVENEGSDSYGGYFKAVGWGVYGYGGPGNGGEFVGAVGVVARGGSSYGISATSQRHYAGRFEGPDGSLVLTGAGDGDNGTIHSDPDVPNSDLVFYSNDNFHIHLDEDNNQQSQFRIYNGANNITFQVEASGKVVVPVLQITGGSDLSEQFEIQGNQANLLPSPGMVVCIDPEHPGKLIISTKAYDRTVAGIISGAGGIKPGMLMGQSDSASDGWYPVALVGRVYVWADASYGSIEPGDLLTTSDTPGHAMKVTDYERAQGAILGKAMSSLEEGRGLVLVLVTLQ
jgi:hypothetical protein